MALALDFLRIAQGLIAVFGLIIIYYASKSYVRTKSRSMLLLGIGFAFVTIGAVLAGVLFELLNVDLASVSAVQAISQALGFLIIVCSLAVTKD